MRRTATLLCAAAALVLTVAGPALATHSGDLDCDDFSSQADAQAHLDAHPSDPDNLDPDGDGVACEQLSTGTTGGEGEAIARTGSSTLTFVGIGGGALLAGALLVARSRRREASG